jgi:hypothetical protein
MTRHLPWLLLFALACGSAAHAQQVYRWVDGKGEVHYTNDPASIPKGVKATPTEGDDLSMVVHSGNRAEPAARREGAQESSPSPQGGVSPQDGASAGSGTAPGNWPEGAEQVWRERFTRARSKVEQARRQLEAATRGKPDASAAAEGCGADKAHCAPGLSPEEQALVHRVKQLRDMLQAAQERLDKLEQLAKENDVPTEWWK